MALDERAKERAGKRLGAGAHWGHVHLHACALHVHTCAAHANLHVLTSLPMHVHLILLGHPHSHVHLHYKRSSRDRHCDSFKLVRHIATVATESTAIVTLSPDALFAAAESAGPTAITAKIGFIQAI